VGEAQCPSQRLVSRRGFGHPDAGEKPMLVERIEEKRHVDGARLRLGGGRLVGELA
jgi:hypothetical protein